MDLIDRKALDDAFTDLRWGVDGNLGHWGDRPDWCLHGHEIEHLIQSVPTVPAVPLDKLCEWLEKNATMDCDGCRATIGSCEGDDGDESVCNARERWKIMLTKWMEGLDAAD